MSPSNPDEDRRSVTDLELLRAWRNGEAEAGSTLLDRHFTRLVRFFRGRVDEDADLADLVQSTLFACAKHPENFVEKSSFRAYLLGIAHKELLMHLRKEGRRGRAMVRIKGPPPEQTSPSGRLALKVQQRLLLKAIRSLPLESQLILELFYWEELAYEDIAAVLDIALGTVSSRLFRAKSALREMVQTLEADPAVVESTLTGFDDWMRSVRRVLKSQEDSGP